MSAFSDVTIEWLPLNFNVIYCENLTSPPVAVSLVVLSDRKCGLWCCTVLTHRYKLKSLDPQA